MKKSIFTFAVAIAALSYAGSASAHPINPFRHLSDLWNKTEAPKSEKTLSTAHPGKTAVLENEGILKNLSNNGGRKALSSSDDEFGGATGGWSDPVGPGPFPV